MSRDIKGKVVVVTGGANGIGFQIADKFLENEAKSVILLDINEDAGKQAVNTLTTRHGDGKVEFIKCDVTADLEIADEIMNKYNVVDVLVNSAGVAADARKTIAINTTALIEWSMKFEGHMRTGNGGRGGTIINIASLFGYKPFFNNPVYCASKYAVVGFTRSLGHEYNFNQSNVRVVAICPGFTETDLTAPIKVKIENGEIDEYTATYVQNMPWQTVGVVGDAAVKVFQEASSGSCWLIEGGSPVEEISFNDS